MTNHGKDHHHGEAHHEHEHRDEWPSQHGRKPWHWHRDWRLWVGVVLMLSAMAVYVMSDSEALCPGGPPQEPVPAAP